jgi:sensor histidine kinase YesM
VLDNIEHDEDVSLGEEWALAQRYLALEKLRCGDRLRVESNLTPSALACRIPSLTLQPLIENAIHYAIAVCSSGGTVRITADRARDRLLLVVEDDGPGATEQDVHNNGGLGLSTVRRRLALRYPDGTFSIETAPGAGFRVRIEIPAMPFSS